MSTETKRLPDEIHNVSMGFFSIARFYGGCKYEGEHYTYFPDEDKLVRDSVLLQRAKEAKKASVEAGKKKPVRKGKKGS